VFQRSDDPVELAVSLANSWDTLEDPPELLKDVETLERFLGRRELAGPDRLTEDDLRAVRAIRDRLRDAFTAADEQAAVEILNEVLYASRANAQLERADGDWHFRYVGTPVDVVAAAASWSLLEAIRVDGWDRFGTCEAAPCCCVFVDRSRNRSRRFCSELCANRYAQASHRQRARQSRK
jgi:predicted RNA-binding Zn ribbon-like protein